LKAGNAGTKVLLIKSRTFEFMEQNGKESFAEIIIEAITWVTVLLVFTMS
jgi:hypothetical protein